MCRYYQMSDEERRNPEISGLSDYIPNSGVVTADSNRDVGAYQGGGMRFGAKHNAMFQALADMIRWKLRLPNRHTAGVQEETVEE